MTETAGQLLSHVTSDCQWTPQASPNPSSTASAYPWFPNNVREWTRFFRAVRLAIQQNNLPPGQFPTFTTNAQPLRVEDDAKTHLYTNALFPVEGLLPQGLFGATPTGFLGASDYVLCTNNYAVAKMPVEIKMRHNLNIYRYANWSQITDPNFKFKKRILSQIFGKMACNSLHYGILLNYCNTYFLKREETIPTTLYVSRVVQPTNTNPTLRKCVYYISQLAINDNINYHPDDSDGSDYNGDEYVSLGKRKRISKSTIASSFKRIITKTCDTYKKQEKMKTLKHEAHIYSILKECHDIPHLFYNSYIYDGYLFALALQLIEDSRHIDPLKLTKKKKELIVNQLKSIHNFELFFINDTALSLDEA
ncbi:hypothetical protein C1645_831462 [Glomus cerebriforme]|uniref:Uncharacterized protein n=1 Tax=Glomus cerebriforme TaxID=658196 RepID=A0A397SJD0_9GLOM|nr:hypothetical protein C1645_831462 [Glomus cerebriforme]